MRELKDTEFSSVSGGDFDNVVDAIGGGVKVAIQTRSARAGFGEFIRRLND